MMQQSRRQHGSSGELDVFRATSYFAGGLPDCPSKPADRMIQESKVRMMEDEQLGLHDDERHGQLGGVAKPSGKSKLAALLSFVVSPSPRASFRKETPPSPPLASKLLAAAGDEPANKASSSSSSSRESSVQLQGCGGVHELDLGVATGDRRLQGVRVVRGRSGGEERWVVRCGAWDWDEEEHLERMLDDGGSSDPKDEVEEGDDGNPGDDDLERSSRRGVARFGY
ncbi:hypothetical protein SETIT_9G365000v2 [Setaria italica]|uniref:Uncharacterized protein n=1 Tax=Setaria italica TaxID=4555 RepID=K4AES8_SETIT|nr:hypothetical protein SETIT_9G365000v2 [Setaria italica]